MNFLPLVNALSIIDAIKYSEFGFVLVLLVLAFLAIFVMVLTRAISGKKKDVKEEFDATVSQPMQAAAPAVSDTPVEVKQAPVVSDSVSDIPHTAGYVVLDGISEQDAAVIMAITSEKTGIALDHLDFKSIRRITVLENVAEQDAAAIMAITSKRTGIPLENLIFNSIKLVED